MATKYDHTSNHSSSVIRDNNVSLTTTEPGKIMVTIQAKPDPHPELNLSTPGHPIPRYKPAYSLYRSMRKLRVNPYRHAQLVNAVASPVGLKTGPAHGRREPENVSRDSPRDRGPIQNLLDNPNNDTHLDHTLRSLGLLVPTKPTTMAKSMRSKSKRAFRRNKREDGVYAAADAARLARLSAKLAAKISADKDGDQAMEAEQPNEQPVEGEGEHLFDHGHIFRGVDAGGSNPVVGDIPVNVAGGEGNLNMQSMDLGEGVEDSRVETEKLGQTIGLSLVYDDSDVEMMSPKSMEEPRKSLSAVNDHWYERTTIFHSPLAKVEAYEDMDDGSSIGDETELITPAQPSVDDPEIRDNDPLFPYEHTDPLSEAMYGHIRPLEQLEDASDGDKRVDYSPLFEGDVYHVSPY